MGSSLSLFRPENLLLEPDNRTLKLIDFGESQVVAAAAGAKTEATGEDEAVVVGDLEFAAPEVLNGEQIML